MTKSLVTGSLVTDIPRTVSLMSLFNIGMYSVILCLVGIKSFSIQELGFQSFAIRSLEIQSACPLGQNG